MTTGTYCLQPSSPASKSDPGNRDLLHQMTAHTVRSETRTLAALEYAERLVVERPDDYESFAYLALCPNTRMINSTTP